MSKLMDHPAACSLHLRTGTASAAIAAALAFATTVAAPAGAQEVQTDSVSDSMNTGAEDSRRRVDRREDTRSPKVTESVASRDVAAGSSPGTQGKNPPVSANGLVDLKAGEMDVPVAPPQEGLPEVPQIISDREFNASIPVLNATDDAELDKPLESIEAFERRIAAQQSNSTPNASPTDSAAGISSMPNATVSPTLTNTAPLDGGKIGDAPIQDAELNVPLPPLDQFEVAPIQFADDAPIDHSDVEVRYRVDLRGLEAVDEETKANMASMFKSASALEKGDGKASNTAMINARMTEDSALLQTVLASEGWYSASVRTRLERPRDTTDLLTARVTVRPGKRYVFSDIIIQASPTLPPNLIADNFGLKVGEPIVADRVQGAEAKIALVLPENGYPFAKVGERDILLDTETAEGVYTLPVNIGTRGTFGGFTTDGDLAFDAKHIGVLARFKRGELYDSRKVDDLRKALVATSLFSTVSVEPQETGQFDSDGSEFVNLYVKQDAGPPRTIAGSLGYAAGEGITAEGTWTHRNKFKPEGAVIAHAIAGTQQQGAGVTFRRSNAGKRDRTLEIVTEAFHNDYDAYSAYTGRIAARISRDSTPLWQKRYTYAYGMELLATAETDYDRVTGGRKRNTYYVAGLNGQIGLDTSDDLLNPTKGYRLTALVQPETTVRGGFDPYVRARLDASTYYAVNDSVVLAGRVRFGTIQGAGLFDIAPSRRLYAGGGGSVRGFSFQGLGEQAPDGKPVGGRSLNEGSFEARYRFGNYGVVAFIDAGQAYRETTPQFNNLRYGVGIGGRFYTNFGPIRLDLATPLGRKPGESRLNIYVSIGQAF